MAWRRTRRAGQGYEGGQRHRGALVERRAYVHRSVGRFDSVDVSIEGDGVSPISTQSNKMPRAFFEAVEFRRNRNLGVKDNLRGRHVRKLCARPVMVP